jgi:hypothetical protein
MQAKREEGMDGFAAARTGARRRTDLFRRARRKAEALARPFAALGAPFGVPYAMRNVHHGSSNDT